MREIRERLVREGEIEERSEREGLPFPERCCPPKRTTGEDHGSRRLGLLLLFPGLKGETERNQANASDHKVDPFVVGKGIFLAVFGNSDQLLVYLSEEGSERFKERWRAYTDNGGSEDQPAKREQVPG